MLKLDKRLTGKDCRYIGVVYVSENPRLLWVIRSLFLKFPSPLYFLVCRDPQLSGSTINTRTKVDSTIELVQWNDKTSVEKE